MEKLWTVKTMIFGGKYIAKMINLTRLLVKLMYFETELFVRVVRNQNQGYISGLCIP